MGDIQVSTMCILCTLLCQLVICHACGRHAIVRAIVRMISLSTDIFAKSAELQSLLLRIQGQPNSARENLINSFSCEFVKFVLL